MFAGSTVVLAAAVFLSALHFGPFRRLTFGFSLLRMLSCFRCCNRGRETFNVTLRPRWVDTFCRMNDNGRLLIPVGVEGPEKAVDVVDRRAKGKEAILCAGTFCDTTELLSRTFTCLCSELCFIVAVCDAATCGSKSTFLPP